MKRQVNTNSGGSSLSQRQTPSSATGKVTASLSSVSPVENGRCSPRSLSRVDPAGAPPPQPEPRGQRPGSWGCSHKHPLPRPHRANQDTSLHPTELLPREWHGSSLQECTQPVLNCCRSSPLPRLSAPTPAPGATCRPKAPSRPRRLAGTSQMPLSRPLPLFSFFFTPVPPGLALGPAICGSSRDRPLRAAGDTEALGTAPGSLGGQPPAPCPGAGSGRARPTAPAPSEHQEAPSPDLGRAVGDQTPPRPAPARPRAAGAQHWAPPSSPEDSRFRDSVGTSQNRLEGEGEPAGDGCEMRENPGPSWWRGQGHPGPGTRALLLGF